MRFPNVVRGGMPESGEPLGASLCPRCRQAPEAIRIPNRKGDKRHGEAGAANGPWAEQETQPPLPAHRQQDSQRQAQQRPGGGCVAAGGYGGHAYGRRTHCLGAQVGNSALGALVQAPELTVAPFAYEQSPQLPEAYPIAAKAPALYKGAVAPGPLDMESYPAAALGGDWAAGWGDWTGGVDGQLSS